MTNLAGGAIGHLIAQGEGDYKSMESTPLIYAISKSR